MNPIVIVKGIAGRLVYENAHGTVVSQHGNGFWFIPKRGIPLGGTKRECIEAAKERMNWTPKQLKHESDVETGKICIRCEKVFKRPLGKVRLCAKCE